MINTNPLLKAEYDQPKFNQLSREYGLNPVFLREILVHRNLGMNNTEIALRTGISRVTVNTYIERIKHYEDQEQMKALLALGLMFVAGYLLLKDLDK